MNRLGLFVIYSILLLILFNCQSQDKNGKRNDKDRIENYLTNGRLDSLIPDDDTLSVYLNLSGCVNFRSDKIDFFKENDHVFINYQLHLILGDDEIMNGIKAEYLLSDKDSISFENLLRTVFLLSSNLKDPIEDSTFLMSIGVRNVWGRKYFTENKSEDRSKLTSLYMNVMHKIYPERDEFVPMEIILVN